MGKKTPDTSTLTRPSPVGYVRRKPNGETEWRVPSGGGEPSDKNAVVTNQPKDDAKPKTDPVATAASEPPIIEAVAVAPVVTEPKPVVLEGPKMTEQSAEVARARTKTAAMSAVIPIGDPPAMPVQVQDPTQMPAPGEISEGSPTDPALPPGRVPPGDSRSLRRGGEFALVYRQGTFVISRFGTIGQRGQWRVVEYPTSASASHSYAKECSRFVGDGFSDYRE